MKNMKMSAKLMLSFLLVIVLSLAVGATGIYGMTSLQQGASDLYDNNLVAVSAMADLRALFNQERNDMRGLFLSINDPAAVQKYINGFTDYAKTAEKAFAQYESSITPGVDESAYYSAKEAYIGAFAQMKKDVFALIDKGELDAAYTIFIERDSSIIPPITNGLSASTTLNGELAVNQNVTNDALYRTLCIVLIAILAAAVITAVVLAIYVSGIISKPLFSMCAALTQIGSRGDLAMSADTGRYAMECARRKDEIGQLSNAALSLINRLSDIEKSLTRVAEGDLTISLPLLSDHDTIGHSLNKMTESLNQIFSEIYAASSQVSSASRQIASGAQTLAQGSTEQASAAEQLSSSVSGIADKTRQNASIAKQAANLSDTIRTNAEKGSVQMDNMMQAVKEINEASRKIEKVIKVIDELASQTNILALNASVEAARAGQHGKGFAVVADEVRSLAAKSAEAAKDTGGLIVNSIDKANLGLSIATETAASLREIVDGINNSAKIVAQIAQSSEEQSAAIAQINTGIEQVAQVVQQNSATAQQSAAASQEMNGQSDMLSQLIRQFKLKNEYARPQLAGAASRGRRTAAPDNASFESDGFGKY